jgi:hypothetical protein
MASGEARLKSPRRPRASSPDFHSSVTPAPITPRAVAREFRALLDSGAVLEVAGQARADVQPLFAWGYRPRHRIDLFGNRFYLCELRENPDLRFFVTYVQPATEVSRRRPHLYTRLFYKDVSLIWRSASHFACSASGGWIGKGDVVEIEEDGALMLASDEATTDLPLELQPALDNVAQRAVRVRTDHLAPARVLRNAPEHRVRAYADFYAPLRQAAADPRQRINRGRPIAWFERTGDPTSLVFAPGFAPDFAGGVIEHTTSDSRLYDGRLDRYRILSTNRMVQYLFIAGPHQAWIIPPQATSQTLTSFGVRAVKVAFDDDLCVPGFEYHYLDTNVDPPVQVSQIPPGYAGTQAALDPARADASAWIERLPVVREFRRVVLRRNRLPRPAVR